MTLQGAPQLRNRLRAIQRTGLDLSRLWVEDNEREIANRIPVVTGATRSSVHGEVSRAGGQIVGSSVIGYLTAGTRAHEIKPTRRQVLKFETPGGTIFSKRAMHPATRGDPGILDTARTALLAFTSIVYRLWNGAA